MIDILPVQLSLDKKRELISYLHEKFWASYRARQNQVDNSYRKWIDNYNAKPTEEVRSTPFYNASNFVPQLIRMHVDILTARTSGIIFSTRPFWKPSALLGDVPHEWLEILSDALQWASFHDIPNFQKNLTSILKRCFKSGTTVVKYPWSKTSIFKRKGEQSNEVVKEFLDFKPIPFDDFWVYPLTIETLEEAQIKFHRIRLTKEAVLDRKEDKWWDPLAADKLLLGGEMKPGSEPAREAQSQEAELELKVDVVQPFSAIEAWLNYKVDNTNRYYSCVVVFNPREKTEDGLLKIYYNPYEEDPFADFHLMPREELFHDYCVPEILEQSQEEQAQVHNGRRDASTITNTPGWKKKRGANVPNPSSSWYPNKVFEVDNMDDIEPLQLRPQYNAMLEEENAIVQTAERYTGVTPPMQGFGAGVMSGKRGIYNTGGTLALLAEGNRRLDMYLKSIRDPMHRVGRGIFTSYRDFGQSKLERFQKYEKYAVIKQIFQESQSGGGLFFEIAASDAGVNKEIDRTSLLLMANTMAAYYQRILEASSVVAQLPADNPIRELILSVLDGARDLANRILFSFDQGDRKRLVPDVRTILGGGMEGANRGAQQAGLPPTEQPLSPERLRQFSENAGAIQAGAGRPNGRPS